MANAAQLEILKQGVEVWNEWRSIHIFEYVDLSGANINDEDFNNISFNRCNLKGVDLSRSYLMNLDLNNADLTDANLNEANLRETDLTRSKLIGTNLIECNLRGSTLLEADLSRAYLDLAHLNRANLEKANFSNASLRETDLTSANLKYANLSNADCRESKLAWSDLTEANLKKASFIRANLHKAKLYNCNLEETDMSGANLIGAKLNFSDLKFAKLSGADCYCTDLSNVNLTGANLQYTNLVEANISNATLSNCKIYGLSAWDLVGNPKDQTNLIITRQNEPIITVDNLQIAQFVHLLLNNSNVRNVIDTITSKVVLILGRFAGDRKSILDNIRDKLRCYNLSPILFDFDKPASKDVTGTVETLARMSRFIIADVTEPGSIPHELASIIPHLRTTPVLPIQLLGSTSYSMFADYQGSYPWVLPTHKYKDGASLIRELPEIIAPANEMAELFRSRG